MSCQSPTQDVEPIDVVLREAAVVGSELRQDAHAVSLAQSAERTTPRSWRSTTDTGA